MKPTIPNSNHVILSGKEWFVTIALFLIISSVLYTGWYHWEKLPLEKDFRSTCWGERMSDYWAYSQWAKTARERHRVLLIGSSVIWGQEVSNTETLSHFLNEELGREDVANLGIDGLTNAAMTGLFRHYGRYLRGANIILEFNPLWMSSPRRDLRGKRGDLWQFHHPRLVPQFDRRISYYRGINERIGYFFENYLKIPPLVRHLMVNYFENKSIAAWQMDHPYRLPPGAITFRAAPMMKEKQGLGTSWSSRENAEIWDNPFLSLDESLQWEFFLGALELLKKKDCSVFVLIGPYNTHCLTEKSRGLGLAMVEEVKRRLDQTGHPYFDTTQGFLPSGQFADQCHLLKDGHMLLAKTLVKDAAFRKWLGGLK